VFKNKMLRNILGTKRDEAHGQFRILYNELCGSFTRNQRDCNGLNTHIRQEIKNAKIF
jgi:hypothetical protein